MFTISMTVEVENEADVLNVSEKVNRLSTGLILDGHSVYGSMRNEDEPIVEVDVTIRDRDGSDPDDGDGGDI